MNFVSIAFFVFFAILLCLQALIKPAGVRRVILLAASYVFYGWWDWRFCFLMLGLTLVAYVTALMLEKHPKSKAILCVGVAVPLAVLLYFKYTNFFIDSFCTLFGIAHQGALRIILPVGISFYTFQSLSYTIDVWRGKVKVSHSFVKFALYISFFPQLVAGPIVKAADFLPQLDEDRRPSRKNVWRGMQIFVWGMLKKAVLADQLSVFVDSVYAAPAAFSSSTVLLAVIAYAMQIYFDFSGYSDMAIGSAKCMGYDLDVNFDLPYISQNVSEFWKRWHISLSTWLQQYLYIPLGGNRKGQARTYVNLMLTMLLGGLWHGAGINFVLWGALHGAALCIHKAWSKRHPKREKGWLRRAINVLATFAFVSLCWVFFRAQSVSEALLVLKKLVVWENGVHHLYTWALAAPAVLMLGTLWCARKSRNAGGGIHEVLSEFNADSFVGVLLFTLLAGLTLILMHTGSSPFIYFQF